MVRGVFVICPAPPMMCLQGDLDNGIGGDESSSKKFFLRHGDFLLVQYRWFFLRCKCKRKRKWEECLDFCAFARFYP